ncbi:transglycosylase SLT domain-containing protein [Kangiella sp. HZ709]|uniref:transglycosylase SLT domain-containing protein n=1 Tax=Kangiella sp. HZ709 TaxID=2666328 RepID=UPI0012AFCE04|nr:transglycosylase SLT domain-containing protein [Kangiella sp. HZ709]MRX28307.1 transglycosylase SLT domain-containing protein [Kangiella sp. HZ709]
MSFISSIKRSLLVVILLTTSVFVQAQEDPGQAFKDELKSLLNAEHHFVDEYDAKVWMKDMSIRLAKRAPHIPEKERLKILALVHKHSNAAGVDPQMVLAIMEVESNFDRYALSVAYARGLMQIMPFWIKEIGTPEDDLFDIETNIKYGCYIYKLYLKYEKGNTTLALGRYNGSRGKMKYPRKVYAALRKRWAL